MGAAELRRSAAGLLLGVEHRQGHYMPASLLGSQLSTLEPLQPDEPGAVISGTDPPAEVADHVLSALGQEVPS